MASANLKPQSIATKNQRIRDIENKKYYCIDCDKAYRDKASLNEHLNGLRHHPERLVSHSCVICNYTTRLKANLKKHEKTKKHIKKIASTPI